MLNTLKENDIMILNKMAYKFNNIKRFDIVVIDIKSEYIIKRVIGLPGDKIEYKNNNLYVNGKEVKEKFLKINHKGKDTTEDDYDIDLDNYDTSKLGSDVVPEGHYFVLGDNRPNSMDSRYLGFIPEDDIVGKATFIIFPFDRFGSKK